MTLDSGLSEQAGPLYEKVKDYIRRNIEAGHWTTDTRLPSENDLVAQLGVSRMTVHRALRELTAAGLLRRIQGVGTFVAVPRPQSALVEINDIAAEIRARGHAHRSKVLRLETVTASTELMLGFEMTSRRPLYHSVVVHFENDMPVQREERFVNPALVPGYAAQDFSTRTTFDYLQSQAPLTEVEHVITAVAADAAMAAELAVPPGDPCLLLHRRTWSGATVATVNRLTYVGSRYALGSRYLTGTRAG
ncbi:histidine utilization repressor [Methylobrevis albus]|uniref:Histidine utilization repressor n=1 Tax=Methylobrevis albus TaxID=2793297 RepID=A0A931MXK6_9HYPH|nr:histidine utilization repressor [Methylobrevis albus]MBH0237025.1 histidine utilization repressor [Methylobrevis albus]